MSAVAASLTNPRFRRGLVVPLVLLVAWQLITHYKLANVHLLASPSAVLKSFVVQVKEGELFSQLLASLQRDLSGFLLGSFAGLLLGSAMGVWRIADRLFGPSFDAAKQVAVFAMDPADLRLVRYRRVREDRVHLVGRILPGGRERLRGYSQRVSRTRGSGAGFSLLSAADVQEGRPCRGPYLRFSPGYTWR